MASGLAAYRRCRCPQKAAKMKTRLFDKNSILYPVVKQKIINLCETLKQNKLNCWIGFNSYGVKVTRLDEKTTINIKGGYGTSQQLVFFDFIIPFLKDTVVKTLDETLETCRVRGLRPEEPYIRERR